MRLARFDTRVRTLNGLAAAFSNRTRYLNALGCTACQPQKMGRLRSLRGLPFADGNWNRMSGLRGLPFADGNWNRMAGLGRLGQGDTEFEPGFGGNPTTPIDTSTYDPSGGLIQPTYAPLPSSPYSTMLPGFTPPNAATLTPSTYDPTTGLIAPTATLPASSSPGQPSLTAAQVAATAAAVAPQVAALTLLPSQAAAAANTTFGIPNSYLLYGGAIFAGLMLLGGMSKKR
jgi:hypothetical protein